MNIWIWAGWIIVVVACAVWAICEAISEIRESRKERLAWKDRDQVLAPSQDTDTERVAGR